MAQTYDDPFRVSLDTLIGASMVLGHRLEDRTSVRDSQDPEIVATVQQRSTRPLRGASQQRLFAVAPLDVLVTERDGRKAFHIIELNGAGIGGLTNLSADAVGAVLQTFQQVAATTPRDGTPPLIMVASSGLESEHQPRLNRLIYEKVLYAEALRRGYVEAGAVPMVNTVNQVREAPWEIQHDRPTIVLGYMKQFLRNLSEDDEGRLWMFGRRATGAVNDRFCLNIVHEHPSVDLGALQTMNRCFVAGADKSAGYALINDYLAGAPSRITSPTRFTLAHDRDQLIGTVLEWLAKGHRAVIKPRGTGLGHGIEFFLSANEPEARIIDRIDGSLTTTERFYGLTGGALPYTVCEFLDTATIRQEGHPMFGHKYEIRIVVYRDGTTLKAFPSIVKVSSQVYHEDSPTHLSLINNITASSSATLTAGVDHMMPLCRQSTLDLLDLTVDDLAAVSELATGVIGFVLDQLEDQPARLGLPTA